ncbi:hypothetical protein FA95DRAFT_1559886, partial [Auriscalpium vulgare]
MPPHRIRPAEILLAAPPTADERLPIRLPLVRLAAPAQLPRAAVPCTKEQRGHMRAWANGCAGLAAGSRFEDEGAGEGVVLRGGSGGRGSHGHPAAAMPESRGRGIRCPLCKPDDFQGRSPDLQARTTQEMTPTLTTMEDWTLSDGTYTRIQDTSIHDQIRAGAQPCDAGSIEQL